MKLAFALEMNTMGTVSIDSKYNGSLTREQFLFYEMRTTARLMVEGLSDDAIVSKITEENLFQYPTEREIKKMAQVCITRLRAMDDDTLIDAVANKPSEVAKQICLYAMMKYNRLVWDFMVTIIGEKYRQQDMSFSKVDMNVFFIRLQEQNETVASWKDSTVNRIKQVLVRVLVENEYIDNNRSDHLNPVMIDPLLENAIKCNNDDIALPAFNCFM